MRLINKDFVTYGACRALGKAIAAFLMLVSPAWAGPVTVLALGDSLTQGYGLVEDQGFVPQMQKWIADQGLEARLVNGGVSGDTTTGGAARVEWSLTPEVDAMIVTLGGNDLLRGLDPAMSRGNIEEILKVAKAKGIEVLLVGMTAPGNYGAEYKADFDAIYPELSEAYGTLYAGNFFAGLGEGSPADLQAYFQADGIHPNAEGVARIVEALGPKVVELITAAK
ncbi:Esterase TesA precursor [Roseovarius gaetbuli]|uniref:Esterase TesA n=1 Tax=Roseovarius gaetbuli TaxID=1356575 RepID=A0A1X6YQY8_9RHOB|nr:Esterase TesA precursor [Roseovarius gaetbuli]